MATGRRWLALAIGVLVVWPLAGPAPGASKTVLLKGMQFEPKTVQVTAGDTVVWRYESGQRHSVQFENGGPEIGCTGLLRTDCLDRPGEERSRSFPQAGTFAYRCSFHGDQGMSGVVKVVATGSSAEPSLTTSSTRPSSTTTTTRPSTTTTTRLLTTSSTIALSTTTTAPILPTTTIPPNEPPPLEPGDGSGSLDGDTSGASGETAASRKDKGRDSSAAAVIVALLAAVATGGGFLLWRLRPSRGAPPAP